MILYDAISVICKSVLATKVPESSAAGNLILSNKKIKIKETIIKQEDDIRFDHQKLYAYC